MVIKTLLNRISQDTRSLRRQADTARDAADWSVAAQLYTEVVRIDPNDAAMWVQLGHAQKEAGRLDQAEETYLKARELRPDDLELLVQLGHLYKTRGNTSAAIECYRTALAGGIDDPHALHFLESASKSTRLPSISDEIGLPIPADTEQQVQAGLFFDYSDLLFYFRDSRLPTGIQRVQIKLWQALMAYSGEMPIHACVYSEKVQFWVPLDLMSFSALCELTVVPGTPNDPVWLSALATLDQRTASARPLQFPSGSTLVNFGSSWWRPDNMAQVRAAKARYGIRYIPLVYDLIPIITPDHVSANLTETFAAWMGSVFMHSDVLVAISSCTGRDIIRYAAAADMPVQPPIIMPLDADFEEAAVSLTSTEVSAQLDAVGLFQTEYVLFVGTLEARKNQMVALKGWVRLIEELGINMVPSLVCVGKQGHGFDAIQAFLASRPKLSAKVILMSGVSDGLLRALYSGCLFTVYTSTYEGWGLPVTESLCHGKVCLAGNHSSLPEAGGRFAVYCDSESVGSFVEQARRLVSEPDIRRNLEQAIADGFKPRQWSEVLADFVVELNTRLATLPPPAPLVAPVALGRRYRTGTQGQCRIDRDNAVAEMMRAGASWYGIEHWGMWSCTAVGRLSLTFTSIERTGTDVAVYLTLRTASEPITVTIRAGHLRLGSYTIPVGKDQQVVAVIPAGVAWQSANRTRPLVLQIAVDTMTSLSQLNPADKRQIGVGLVDVTFCAMNDVGSRLAAIERSVMMVSE